MTLTVRLDATLQAALDRHCAHRGVTKTLVVQESLAAYLVVAQPAVGGPAQALAGAVKPASAAFRAFADAGLIGAVAGGDAPADKAAVRARVQQRLRDPADPAR
jgi:predicted transcriptional regulator